MGYNGSYGLELNGWLGGGGGGVAIKCNFRGKEAKQYSGEQGL